MNQKMKDLLQLYENVLSAGGIVRQEAKPLSSLDKSNRLAHARFMVDQLLHPADGKMQIKADDDSTSNRHLGFIQGVLWSEQYFSLAALKDQNRNLGEHI